MLGAMFILVTLLLPKGIVGTFNAWREASKDKRPASTTANAAAEDGITEPKMAE
jgi:urea transport system permease protein